MALARFNIIVAIDVKGGIAREGSQPWHDDNYATFFRDKTVGQHKNVVIMGRKTYEGIDSAVRPLPMRKNVVISKMWNQAHHSNIDVYPTLIDALAGLSMKKQYEEIWVMGGELLYDVAINDLLYLCNQIYVTQYKSDYDCDQFFPIDKVKNLALMHDPFSNVRSIRNTFDAREVVHQECKYLNLLRDVMEHGDARQHDTIGVIHSKFGEQIEFDVSKRLPAVTTRNIKVEMIVRELVWTIRGQTDAHLLEVHAPTQWRTDASKDALAAKKLNYAEFDVGPSHGFCWRHWGANYEGSKEDYTGKGVDQLQKVITGIKLSPHSRDHILTMWDPATVDKMAMPSNHTFIQFYVSHCRQNIDAHLYMRSCDVFQDLPNKLLQYALLLNVIAHVCNCHARRLVISFGELYCHKIQFDAVEKQLERTPRPTPTLEIAGAKNITNIDQINEDTLRVVGYQSWPHVPYKSV